MKKLVLDILPGKSFWITFLFHGFFLFCLIFVKPEVKKPLAFVVRNIKPQTEKVKIAIERPLTTSAPAAKSSKKAVKKIAPQKQKSKEMLKKIVHQLDKVEKLQTIEKKIEKQVELVVPKELPVLQTPSYLEEALMQLFQEKLCLPQKGKVRMKLCISEDGKLLFTEILENQNDFNLSYLQEILPQLSYPEWKGEKSYSYDICFEGCDL